MQQIEQTEADKLRLLQAVKLYISLKKYRYYFTTLYGKQEANGVWLPHWEPET